MPRISIFLFVLLLGMAPQRELEIPDCTNKDYDVHFQDARSLVEEDKIYIQALLKSQRGTLIYDWRESRELGYLLAAHVESLDLLRETLLPFLSITRILVSCRLDYFGVQQ